MTIAGKILMALASAMLVLSLGACKKEGPAERAGKKIDEAVQKAEEDAREAAEEVEKEIEEAGEKPLEKESR
ncbi:MAG: hypothetical protein Kow0025_05260 [Thermodesulfovibrionales bacterium]